VRGLGSIPGWLLGPVAFVVLVVLRFASLALESTKPETTKAQKGKVTPMANVKSILSSWLRRCGRSVPACWLACHSSPELMIKRVCGMRVNPVWSESQRGSGAPRGRSGITLTHVGTVNFG
jgi:hypothetical protein